MLQKALTALGWIATCVVVMMYAFYIPQIMNNLREMKGTPTQPLVAAVDRTLWVIYALLRKNRDYPVTLANTPGIVFGLIAVITAIIWVEQRRVLCHR